MSEQTSTATAMRSAATTLVAALDDKQRKLVCVPFADASTRTKITYLPRPRPGACLADLDRVGRKAVHRLLGTALSDHAFAQAMTVMALEEVLDRVEGGQRGRHSNDFWAVVFGDPADHQWGWRIEGHHLSVTMTLAGDEVAPTPLFFGARPARTSFAGRVVLQPFAAEEDLARAMLDAMSPSERTLAITADVAPADIRSGTQPYLDPVVDAAGIPAERLNPTSRALLDQLVAVYLCRLTPDLAWQQAASIGNDPLHFRWEGPTEVGRGHYYAVQGTDLLIEYDNTADEANHAHTVLRRRHGDFGADVLAAHRAADHGDSRRVR
jgi:Protein of unknown function (DUF3500)